MADGNAGPPVPEWLDSGFFERALRAGLDDPGLRVRRSEVRPATVSGQNYVGLVFGATVTTEADEVKGVEEERQHRLVIKCLPSNKTRQAMYNRRHYFRKEVDMYQSVFKEFSRLASTAATVGVLPWPKHYMSFFDGEGDFIVLEDLRADGYVLGDRLSGLDGEQLELALRGIAKFHAFSYALKLKEPEVFRTKVYDRFQDKLFSPNIEGLFTKAFQQSRRDTASFLRTWGEEKYVRVADWLDSFIETVRMEMSSLLSMDDPGSVLNHGDMWVNNMLFRYSSARDGNSTEMAGKPLGVKFLDFQISRVCSPAGDLSYLYATSTTATVRKEHWENLLKNTYLETFWDTLEALGAKQLAESDVYSWPWLQSEMLRYRPFLLLTLLSVAQGILADENDVPDVDVMVKQRLEDGAEKSPFADLHKGQVYKERLREILDEFLEGGFFQ